MSEITMSPCPYCGNTQIDYWDEADGFYYCEACGLCGPRAHDKILAADRWNGLPRRLRWTKEKPTVEGMYWYKESDNISMTVEVFRERVFFTNGTSADGELLYNMPGYDFDLSVDESNGLWAGPIPEPEGA